ncbi:MAG: hypothetical protein PHY28_03215 [Dehalococcoidales bacterium]|nr:hypothetical protein [Dehalococcoidales bacterium]
MRVTDKIKRQVVTLRSPSDEGRQSVGGTDVPACEDCEAKTMMLRMHSRLRGNDNEGIV